MRTDISIIVSSYNRCHDLETLLGSLEGLTVAPSLKWEVLVVDNNSKDRTRAVTERFMAGGKMNVRYIFEPRQGKSYALNTGIEAAHGAIIAFTDDDCIMDTGWLASLAKEFQADPSLKGIGGRVELYDPRDRPVTIRTSTEKVLFSSHDQLFNLIPGCNMAFSRDVFQKAGYFDERFGPGARIVAAEDSDFIYRVFKSGFKILYAPDVFVYHNHGRRTDAQVARLTQGYVLGRGAFYCKHIMNGDPDALRMAYWEISALTRTICNKRSFGRAWGLLRGLLVGACYYLSGCCRSILANPRLRLSRSL